MHILLVLFILLLNFSIYFVLNFNKRIKSSFLFTIFYFFVMIGLTKTYNILKIKNMPNGFGFFILLMFSWGILVLNLIKKITNERIGIYDKLNLEDKPFINITYLLIITLAITSFQLFLILSKTIYIFRS